MCFPRWNFLPGSLDFSCEICELDLRKWSYAFAPVLMQIVKTSIVHIAVIHALLRKSLTSWTPNPRPG